MPALIRIQSLWRTKRNTRSPPLRTLRSEMERFPFAARMTLLALKALVKLPLAGAWLHHPIAVLYATVGQPERAIPAYESAISLGSCWNASVG